MTEAPSKREQPRLQLVDLSHRGERTDSNSKDRDHSDAKSGSVPKSESIDILRVQDERSQKVDEICWGDVEIDVLEAE